VLVCFCFYLLPSNSTEVITTIPEIADFTDGTITYGTCVGGSSHLNMPIAGGEDWAGAAALRFGACSDTFAMTVAINESLADAGTGISLDKINYRWKWINGCFNVLADNDRLWCAENIGNRLDENMQPTSDYADQFDTLNIIVQLSDSNGNIIETKTYDYDTWYSWYEENAHSMNEVMDDANNIWQITEDHIELFNHTTGSGTIYTPSDLGNITFIVNGQDNGQSEGYYGPVVKDGEMWFTYRNNPCDLDTLYNPTCPGYAEKYVQYLYDQACAASALYDQSCPGYWAAYLTQQCTINPLYNASCGGYKGAYFTQQCNLNDLYSEDCSGYDAAYLDQQCNLNDLYSEDCSGYSVAYLDQQCTYDSLYDLQCPMYQVAYYDQQCNLDPQHDIGCSGYNAPTVSSGIDNPIAAIIDPIITDFTIPTVVIPVMPEYNTSVEVIIPEFSPIEEITMESLDIEIAQMELELDESRPEEPIETISPEPDTETDTGSDPDTIGDTETQESTEQKEKKQSESSTDGESKEEPDNESEGTDDGGDEEDAGEDTSTEGDNATDEKEEPVKEPITTQIKKEEIVEPTKDQKKKSRKDKMRELIAKKVDALTKKVEEASTIEEQMVVQAQLLALVAFVPDFDYAEKTVPDIYFYPPVPTVDHAFSRWFVNDPTFGAMENLQYPSLRN